MPKKVLLAGYYGFGNTGDEAILSAILHDLRSLATGIELCVVSASPAGTRKRYGVDVIAWRDLSGIIRKVRACDLVLLGGGGVFNDYWGAPSADLLTPQQAGIPFYSSFPLLSSLLEKPMMVYAAGVGPLRSEGGKELTRLAFELASTATVRDR
ncbi:MAG TPA: polysaccharide pyruvyl transferase family protein, partial [bacterium]|nr:polysaccharide pyruvyl transferase family protein [bacterium]